MKKKELLIDAKSGALLNKQRQEFINIINFYKGISERSLERAQKDKDHISEIYNIAQLNAYEGLLRYLENGDDFINKSKLLRGETNE